jgi:Flp pilus assembly protein CpaB
MPRTPELTADPGRTPDPGRAAGPRRVTGVRQRVLSTRSIVGGLLVTAAMLGTLVMSDRSDRPPDTVLVAQRDIRVGEPLTAHDVVARRATLPDDARSGTVSDPSVLDGAVALAPLQAGDLVRASAVLSAGSSDAAATAHEYALAVERERALDGDIARGERVDVLATYGTGDGAYTVVTASRAEVIDVGEASGGLGEGDRLVVVLGLGDGGEVIQTAHASVAATVTLVRATRAGPSDEVPESYTTPTRPQPPRP